MPLYHPFRYLSDIESLEWRRTTKGSVESTFSYFVRVSYDDEHDYALQDVWRGSQCVRDEDIEVERLDDSRKIWLTLSPVRSPTFDNMFAYKFPAGLSASE
jgi:hypothetical protein